MMTEWNAACGPDDPVLVVPWSSPDGELAWVDLREDPYAVNEIPEAEEHPALLAALRALNGTRSVVFTAKCDVWPIDEEELSALRDELLLDEEIAKEGLASYLDLVWRDRAVFVSRHRMEQMLHRMERMLSELPNSLASAEMTMRPAVVDLDGSVAEGFALSLYIKGIGVDAIEAEQRWDEALRAATAILRSKEITSN